MGLNLKLHKKGTRGSKAAREKARRALPPELTLSSNGMMIINESAWGAMGEPERVLVYYDSKEEVIGLAPASEEEAGIGYSVSPNSADRYQFSARGLYTAYDLGPKAGRRMAGRRSSVLDKGLEFEIRKPVWVNPNR